MRPSPNGISKELTLFSGGYYVVAGGRMVLLARRRVKAQKERLVRRVMTRTFTLPSIAYSRFKHIRTLPFFRAYRSKVQSRGGKWRAWRRIPHLGRHEAFK
jgi:hypothetical protein